MITLKDFMEVVNYRITEGSNYGWSCFGYDSYCLDSWNGDNDNGYTISVVFDTQTQTVYQAEAHDYQRQRSYRLTHPDYVKYRQDEAQHHGVDDSEAWDDVKFVDLESADDFLEKARAIVAGEDYDTRVSIPVDIPDDVLFVLMKDAHDKDITLNQLFEKILLDAIDRAKVVVSANESNDDVGCDEDDNTVTVVRRVKKKR